PTIASIATSLVQRFFELREEDRDSFARQIERLASGKGTDEGVRWGGQLMRWILGYDLSEVFECSRESHEEQLDPGRADFADSPGFLRLEETASLQLAVEQFAGDDKEKDADNQR